MKTKSTVLIGAAALGLAAFTPNTRADGFSFSISIGHPGPRHVVVPAVPVCPPPPPPPVVCHPRPVVVYPTPSYPAYYYYGRWPAPHTRFHPHDRHHHTKHTYKAHGHAHKHGHGPGHRHGRGH